MVLGLWDAPHGLLKVAGLVSGRARAQKTCSQGPSSLGLGIHKVNSNRERSIKPLFRSSVWVPVSWSGQDSSPITCVHQSMSL